MFDNSRIITIIHDGILIKTFEYNAPIDMDELDGIIGEEIAYFITPMTSTQLNEFIQMFGVIEFHHLYRKYYKLMGSIPKQIEPIIAYAIFHTWMESIRPSMSLTDYLEKRSAWLAKRDLE